jgi:hypothetical protein
VSVNVVTDVIVGGTPAPDRGRLGEVERHHCECLVFPDELRALGELVWQPPAGQRARDEPAGS